MVVEAKRARKEERGVSCVLYSASDNCVFL